MKTYQNQAEWSKAHEATPEINQKLDRYRFWIKENKISYGELSELQDLADYIPLGDVELLEAAGIPEFLEAE